MANKITQDHINYLNQGIKATNMSSAFKDAELEGIDILDITNLDTSLCTSFSYCFENYKYNVKADNAIDMYNATSCSNMFIGSNIEGLHLKNVRGGRFQKKTVGGTEGETYIIDSYIWGPVEENTNLKEYAMNYISDYTEAETIPIENLNYLQSLSNVSSLKGTFSALWACKTIPSFNNIILLENIDVSSLFYCVRNIENIDLTWLNNLVPGNSLYETFSQFNLGNNIKTLDLSTWNTKNVTYMYDTFSMCGVNNINLSNWNVSNVTDMGRTFYNNSYLESINLTNWDTSKVTSFNNTFSMCPKLKEIIIDALDLSSCTDVYKMFGEKGFILTPSSPIHLKNVPRSLDLSTSNGTEGVTYIIDNYID